MTVTIESGGKKTRPGRPKGSKDKRPRKRAKSEELNAVKDQLRAMEARVVKAEKRNERLQRGYEVNPLQIAASPKAGKEFTPEELDALVKTGEIPFTGTEDELLALQSRRTMVSRLMLRGVSRASIAQYLDITASMLESDIRAIRRQWRASVNSYNISEAVGESLEFYREVRDLALREASDPNNKPADIVSASQAALRAEDSKNNFLARMGLYDVLDQEKRDAFRANTVRDLDDDAQEFGKVMSFMNAAVTKGGSTVEEVAEEADFSDIAPIEPE